MSGPPGSTCSTGSGTPARCRSAAAASAVAVARSDGFQTTALPAISAGSHFQAGVISGTFQGVTAATTPSGRRSTRAPPADSARGGWAAYQRADRIVHSTSPAASARRFPTSRTSRSASSSRAASTASANPASTAPRSAAGRPAQPGCAAVARVTAASTAAASAAGVRNTSSPVQGSRETTGSLIGRAPPRRPGRRSPRRTASPRRRAPAPRARARRPGRTRRRCGRGRCRPGRRRSPGCPRG